MSPELLNTLKYFLIALIWLFFLRVLRAVYVEARPPKPARRDRREVVEAVPASTPRRRRFRIEALEPAALKGRVYEVVEETTIGRASGCGVAVNNDAFVSNLHARLFLREGGLWVEDLGSTNGTYLNTQRLASPAPLHKGDLLQVGGAVFEVIR